VKINTTIQRIKNKFVIYEREGYIHKQDMLTFIEVCLTERKNKINKPVHHFKIKGRAYLTIGDILQGVSQSFVKEA